LTVLSLVCVLLTTQTTTFSADIVKYDIRAKAVPSTSQTVEYVYTAVTVDGEIVEYTVQDDEVCSISLKEE
jgi:hypothetical protein